MHDRMNNIRVSTSEKKKYLMNPQCPLILLENPISVSSEGPISFKMLVRQSLIVAGESMPFMEIQIIRQ